MRSVRLAEPVLIWPAAVATARLAMKRSSPTSWILFLDDLLPMLCVKDFQPAQSSSAMPSSIETMGYFSAQLVQYADIWKEAKEDLSDFLKMYLPLALS